MKQGLRRIQLLVGLIIFMLCLTVQAQHAQAATVHVIAGKGVSKGTANEFGSIAKRVLDFYQEVYNYNPVNSFSLVVVADEPSYIKRLRIDGYSETETVRLAKVTSGIFLNSKYLDSSNVTAKYTLSGRVIHYENPVIIICLAKTPTYLAKILVVTHEMFHHMQRELIGDTPVHKWLAEGSAKVAESALLEWLGQGSLAAQRSKSINNLAKTKLRADPRDIKNGGESWLKLMEEHLNPYEVSESMTEYLMRRVGKPPVIQYFVLTGKTHNRNTAFRKAFGMSYRQFIDDYTAYIQQEDASAGTDGGKPRLQEHRSKQ